MSASKLRKLASDKGYAITRYEKGVYQYSENGYDWTNINCTWSEFVKIVKDLPFVD